MRRLTLLLCLLSTAALAQTAVSQRTVQVRTAAQFTGGCVNGSVGKASDTGAEYRCTAGAWVLYASFPAASGTVVLNQTAVTTLNPDTDSDGTGEVDIYWKGEKRKQISRFRTNSSWLTGSSTLTEGIEDLTYDSSYTSYAPAVGSTWKFYAYDGADPADPYISGFQYSHAPGADAAAFAPYYADTPGGTMGLDHGIGLGTAAMPFGTLSLIGCHNNVAGGMGVTYKCGGSTGNIGWVNRQTNVLDVSIAPVNNTSVQDTNLGLLGLWWGAGTQNLPLPAGGYCLWKYGIDWDCDNTTDFHRDPGSASAGVTVANTVSETTLIGTLHGSATIPANTMESGSTLRITAWGYHSVTATPTIRIRTKLGGTTFCDSTALTVSNTGAMTWKAECYITTRAAPGAAVATIGQGIATFFTAASTPVQGQTATTASTNLATNGALSVDVTAQWSAASASNTITMTNLTIDRVN